MSTYTDSDFDVVCWRLQGFEVRLFARNLDKAERMFGPDGATVDIVVGDVKDKEALAEAAAGCQAAIYVAGSNSILGGNTYKEVQSSLNVPLHACTLCIHYCCVHSCMYITSVCHTLARRSELCAVSCLYTT
jgi:NAD(P)H-binding